MKKDMTTERVFQIFKELNQIPRPSHHEKRVADYLCQFAQRLHLEYERDAQNCVIIRKPATKGHESAEPIVLLNHMDMVCVGMKDPLNDPIDAYTENGWMKARGTSLGADNGIGLSMALAVLEDDTIVHGPLEVMTTTNEEDGMSGAANLSKDFIKGRKVINLDSEDYDTITTGAAGACLQFHRIPLQRKPAPGGKRRWYHIQIAGGLGGHSGVDINKGRCSAVIPAWAILAAIYNEYDFELASLHIGEANASIASSADIVLTIPSGEGAEFVKQQEEQMNQWLREEYGKGEPNIHCTITKCTPTDTVIDTKAFETLMSCLEQIPQGVVKMSETMKDTVETSNNVGRISTEEDHIFVSTHTRSFVDSEMEALSRDIANVFKGRGASSEIIMSAPAWQEDQQSDFLRLTSDTFNDVLGWRPRLVAMHFVLEAGYFVQHFPGIQIACIGPRIVEPHSTSERIELSTIDDIWSVLQELLRRLA
ncbi:MAG: beta-Ala-His dipeptidase [Prevotella sp.]|nr:beta-Ala-His dipeptidase [Prevotella sp.]